MKVAAIIGVILSPVYFLHLHSELIVNSTNRNLTNESVIIEKLNVNENFVYSEFINSNNYCGINECREIKCELIPKEIDAGDVASAFISSIFKIDCPDKEEINLLKFAKCEFPQGKVKSLKPELPIIELIFEDCVINTIESTAFSSPLFQKTERLQILNATIKTLKRAIFQNFPNLKSLTIRENTIEEIEFNLLGNSSQSLQIIEFDKSINNQEVLMNITIADELPNVQLLSMQGNKIPILTPETFQAFPNILSLYLGSSSVSNIDLNTFESLRSIQQIFINNNLLTSLPENIFVPILSRNPNFRVTISGNPWECICSLRWLQEFITTHPNLMQTIPTCQSPDKNAGLSFLDADFCGESSATTICTFPDGENNCNDLFKPTKKHPRRISNFQIKEYCNNSVLVNFKDTGNPLTLFWLKNGGNNFEVECLRNLKSSVMLNDFRMDSSYILCLVDVEEGPSPLNCLALKTFPSIPKQAWLRNSDKTCALVILGAVLIFFFIIGGVSSFFMILKNPQLIRGSSRVIMVQKGQVCVMILPKGVLWKEAKEENIKSDYLTPIGRRSRLLFKENYYDTIKKGDSKRKSVTGFSMRTTSEGDDVPPPLPPYPRRALRTLSSTVDNECRNILELE